MKKFNLLFAALLVLGTTSMMLIEKNDGQQTTSFSLGNNQPLFYKGMITIKVKAGVGNFNKQKGKVSFNIPSLDAKANKYEVNLIEKRFGYNPNKLKKGMPDLSRIYRIEFPENYPVKKVADEFSKDPNIEYAEPISLKFFLDYPNDSLYPQCNHLVQIFAPEAWDIHHGEDGANVIIAINDCGVDWKHPDLTDNLWQNLGEDADGDGHTIEYIDGEWILDPGDENDTDDDENGFVDDFIGWNFFLNSNDPIPIAGANNNGHGTHCAGIAAGRTNNHQGIASISWNLTFMPLLAKEDNQFGWGHYDALIYAAENGADIISNSWASPVSLQAEEEVIEYVTGLGSIVVAAAGNDYSERLYYPASYPGVISVAAVNQNDIIAIYSSFGPSVDICAPGQILSTLPNGVYTTIMGTSMACPVISGTLGLLKSYHPTWTNDQLITRIISTADSIDWLNPQYQNKLGSGRINAFRALDTASANVPQELKLMLKKLDPQDENNDEILAPGEAVTLNMTFRNYIPCLGEDDVNITIQSDDQEIIIIDGNATANIPPDGYFLIEDQLHIKVSETASSHFARFSVNIETNKPIVYFPDTTFDLLVAPSGVLVFEGEENGQDYSGTFIKSYLNSSGIENTYTNTYPISFKGFDAVFLSHGNFDMYLDKGYFFTEEHSLICQEYLENGGNLYIEMGGMFTGASFFGYQNYLEMKELFGVSNHAIVATQNPIDYLIGISGSPCEGMSFTGSNQLYNWYIDELESDSGAIIPFYENNYGNVSIMFDGSATFGHKVFYLSYALAELQDASFPSTRQELLKRICEFLDIFVPNANFVADTTLIVEGDSVQFTDLSGNNPTNWEWFFEGGTPETSTEQDPVIFYDIPGEYYVKLIVTNSYGADTLVKLDYIHVDSLATHIGVNSTTGISLFPNPAKDKLHITNSGNIQSMIIFNSSGLIVKKQKFSSSHVTMDITFLQEGIYFIRLKIGDEEVTKKFVILR
ncbi:MAG: S8 family serine peptidase [Bacteroidetes bacterium]|nr:S8 family serine peptidase [Bacteroidota bacterium]